MRLHISGVNQGLLDTFFCMRDTVHNSRKFWFWYNSITWKLIEMQNYQNVIWK